MLLYLTVKLFEYYFAQVPLIFKKIVSGTLKWSCLAFPQCMINRSGHAIYSSSSLIARFSEKWTKRVVGGKSHNKTGCARVARYAQLERPRWAIPPKPAAAPRQQKPEPAPESLSVSFSTSRASLLWLFLRWTGEKRLFWIFSWEIV